MTETSQLPDPAAGQYSGVAYEPVPWRHSLLFKLMGVLVLVSLTSAVLGILLTALAHRVVLTSVIPSEVLRDVQGGIIMVLATMVLAAIILSSAAAWLLSRYLTQPIVMLMEAMGRVFKADLTTQVALRRRDEFGALAHFFNSMVEKLREAQERNQAISKLKSQFVSVAAHQLRTPLTGLKWSLHWLLDEKGGPLTSAQRKAVEEQSKATGTMIDLVNELLDVAVVEEGKFRYNLQEVEIAQLAAEAVASFEAVAQARGVTVKLIARVREGLAVIGDLVQLKLTLVNLIDNAVRYSKRGDAVTVELVQSEDWVTVKVADTGIGIPAEEQERVFERFFRASNAQRTQPDGSGLGLFIVRNVVRGHGGKISVTSKENEGTVVTFTLPLRRELVPPESLSEGITSL